MLLVSLASCSVHLPACFRLLTLFSKAEDTGHRHKGDTMMLGRSWSWMGVSGSSRQPHIPCHMLSLGLFPWGKDRARTRVDEIQTQGRTVEGVLSMPGLHFSLPLITLCCCKDRKSRGWGVTVTDISSRVMWLRGWCQLQAFSRGRVTSQKTLKPH